MIEYDVTIDQVYNKLVADNINTPDPDGEGFWAQEGLIQALVQESFNPTADELYEFSTRYPELLSVYVPQGYIMHLRDLSPLILFKYSLHNFITEAVINKLNKELLGWEE